MSRISRLLIASAGVLLGGMFVLPLWTIHLIAPQYPEGLGMVIEINTIRGWNPQDLGNINELNHYIGMKTIDPGAVPALRLMPWVVGALVALALIAAAWGRRSLVIAWLAALVAFGAAGMVDFWRWTYSYGHDLDVVHAIIKIPGTVYQPPIIGTKQILNFTATSWPAAGAWCAFAALVAGALAVILARRARPTAPLPVRADTATPPEALVMAGANG